MTVNTPVQFVTGDKILVKIGDGGSPTETFAHPNLINAKRGVDKSASAVTDEICYTNDQSLPAYTRRAIKATDFSITGEGTLAMDSVVQWSDWFDNGQPKNVQVVVNPNSNSAVTYSGPFVCTSFSFNGDRQTAATCSVKLDQAGPVTRS